MTKKKTDEVETELLTDNEKEKIIMTEKINRGVSSFFEKIFSIIFTLVVVAWFVMCLVDFVQVQVGDKPIFCLKNETIEVKDLGSVSKCTGLGYKVLNFDKLDKCNVKTLYGGFWVSDTNCPTNK